MSKLTRKLVLATVGLLAFTVATSATADLKGYTATLELELLGVNVVSTPVVGVTDVAPDGSFTLPAGIFLLDTVLSSSVPDIAFFTLTAVNLAGSFAPSGTDFGGLMPLGGGAYFSLVTGRTMSVPLSVIGGSPASTLLSGSGGLTGSIAGGPWTAGVAQVFDGSTPIATRTGKDTRAANGNGRIQLVTPVLFTISGASPIDGAYGTFGVLTVNFAPVPEPGTSMLLASGLAGLAFLGRRQRARG